jgi:hypothetical protein
MLPWPSRAERRQQVADAAADADDSRQRADEARSIEQDLHRIMAENNFAGLIADQIIHRHRHA